MNAHSGDLTPFIGAWETDTQDSALILTISEEDGKPHVGAYDRLRKKAIKVSKTRLCN